MGSLTVFLVLVKCYYYFTKLSSQCFRLFGGVMVLRDVIHDNYIRRPKERGKQVGKEGVSTHKSYLGTWSS